MIRFALLAVIVISAPLAAQPSGPAARLRGEAEAGTTRKRLSEAQQKMQAGRATEAADEWQRILDEAGDDLVLVRNNNFQPARKLVQQSMAALPADTLKAYQNRLEEPAKKLLDAGRRDRDPAPLRQLLDRYFISRPAEEAILLLGELLFERGDFRAAEQAWRLLLPTTSAEELSYPSPKTDPALVKAKLLSAAIFAGDLGRAKADATLFAKEHPKASGRLAGTDGVYTDTIAKLLAAPPEVRDGRGPGGWTTFAGNPSRDGALAEPLLRISASAPTWRISYPRQPADKLNYRPASFPAAKSLAFHPVVLDGIAYVADAGRIYSFDLKTRDSRVAFDARALADHPDFSEGELALPNLLDADFTLTAHAGKLYARLGNAALPTTPAEPGAGKSPVSYLVVLQPLNLVDPPKNALTLKPLATLAPPVGKLGQVAWEGAPLVAAGKLFAACSRIDDRGRWIHAVACYDDPPSAKPNWVVDVADTDAATPRQRHEVLTLAGGNVILSLPQGLAVALDGGTGKMAWAFRATPAAKAPANGLQQDLCPAVYAAGRVFFAPADSDKLYALDAETGRPVWEAGPMRVEQILGAAKNRVVVTIAGPQKGIRAYDIATGSDQEPLGWRNHDVPDLGTYGRGLLTPDAVLWPTKQNLTMLSLADGSVRAQPKANPHGNLAYAEGVLLVATPTELWGYVLDRKEPPEPEAKSMLVPAENLPAFRSIERPVAERAPWNWPQADLALGSVQTLTPGAWPLRIDLESKSILVSDGTAIWAWPPDSTKPLWKAQLKTRAAIVRATFDDGHWIVWGDSTIVSVNAANGIVRWQFDSPSREHAFGGGSFAGSRFITLLGPRCLLALDAATGKIAWLRDPLGRPQFREFAVAGSPSFDAHFLAVADVALIRKSDGERWTISADTGRVLHTTATSLTPWTMPPALTAEGLVLVSDGSGAVVAVEPRSNRVIWRFDAGGETGLTGAAPEVRVVGGDALVLIGRNTGAELMRLSAKTGSADWRLAARVPDQWSTLVDFTADAEHLYWSGPTGVLCLGRSGGRKLWQCNWPTLGRWLIVATRRGLLAHASAPIPDEPVAEVFARCLRRFAEWPAPDRLPGLCATVIRAAFAGNATVLMIGTETGEVTSRLDVPSVGPFVQLQRTGFGAVLLGSGSGNRVNPEK